MNACLPALSKPAAGGPSYAADFDQAERASSKIEQAEVEVTAKPSNLGTFPERLSRSSTAGKFVF
jgi:hypothetical protein